MGGDYSPDLVWGNFRPIGNNVGKVSDGSTFYPKCDKIKRTMWFWVTELCAYRLSNGFLQL